MSVYPSVIPCARKLKLVPIPAVVLQNTNQSCMVCVKSEKYAFCVTLIPQSDPFCRGVAEVQWWQLLFGQSTPYVVN